MQSRFEFFEEQYPQLAGYGKKAEEALNSDNNICLLNLGRIAETITENLKIYTHINENITKNEEIVNELINLKVIDDDTARKINTLIEIKHEAAENEYDSQTACLRLLETAVELCEWFALNRGESKFGFLEDLFFPDDSIPPLAHMAEIGREAEENLYINTRYCLICLGDMGEAVVDYLINMHSIITTSPDQKNRIDTLFTHHFIADDMKDSLHILRQFRNIAVHKRYDNNYISETEAKKLLNEVLKLCESLFKYILKPGYIVRGKIASVEDNYISVLIGEIPAVVENSSQNNTNEEKSYIKGKKYFFKIEQTDSEKIILSRLDDYNIEASYSKYRIGQPVTAYIISINNYSGALVKLKDGLLAKIPVSEIGRRLYDFDDAGGKLIKYKVPARVKYFSRTQYPPMILSTKEKDSAENVPSEPGLPSKPVKDEAFRELCKSGTVEEICEALKKGANPNARTRNHDTALMKAARHNRDPKVFEALLNAGANIKARSKNGFTALHFAAMRNIPDVVEFLCSKGADIEALNHNKKIPLDYARINKNLNEEDYIISLLTPKSESEAEPEPIIETQVPVETEPVVHPKAPEYETQGNINEALLRACENGTDEEILELIEKGANVNTARKNNTTPLMIAVLNNKSLETIKTLIEHDADVNAKDNNGNTALHFAIGFNTSGVIAALIKAGADPDAVNNAGITPRERLKADKIFDKLKGTEAMRLLLGPEFKKEFLRMCQTPGKEKEILKALDAGIDVNSANKSHVTALMFAAKFNNAETIQILLDRGADITLKSQKGHSAFDFAKSNENLKGTEILKKLEI